jgi:hypothetical protein
MAVDETQVKTEPAQNTFFRHMAETVIHIRKLHRNEQEIALRQNYLDTLLHHLQHVREKHNDHPQKAEYTDLTLRVLTVIYHSMAKELEIPNIIFARLAFSVYNDAAKQYPELLRVIRATSI